MILAYQYHVYGLNASKTRLTRRWRERGPYFDVVLTPLQYWEAVVNTSKIEGMGDIVMKGVVSDKLLVGAGT